RDLSLLCSPVIPETAAKLAGFLGVKNLSWKDMASRQGIVNVTSEILFKKLEDAHIEELRSRFSGSQKERQEKADAAAQETAQTTEQRMSLEEKFTASVRLKVAKITKIERHPDAEKLYIESISLGAEERTIVSGLVPHYKEDELLGKNIILVSNLKPAKLRGVMSNGMLLAASADGVVEVIFAPDAEPGADVVVRGTPAPQSPAPEITIDEFFSIPITANGGGIFVGNTPLEAGGKPLVTERVKDGKVG
ncbi:MAG: methionine--tRNA ligase, partial [Spirochaetales bacterium]|nr:methionine--tRNA ligase [Spirochaetales bacterium]